MPENPPLQYDEEDRKQRREAVYDADDCDACKASTKTREINGMVLACQQGVDGQTVTLPEIMSGNPPSKFDQEGKKGRKNSKQRRQQTVYDAEDCKPSTQTREINEIILASTKPSYCLKRGVGSSQQGVCDQSLRSLHQKKLRRLLKKLLLRHNWAEASGVLSVLLKGSSREKSISRNRHKYWATLELMQRIKGDSFNQRKIQNVYELWMKKLGPMKKQPIRFAVQLEFILYCLRHWNIEDARQGALCLMQERGFESCPLSNLVVGLTFYELWYSAIPEEMQLRELSRSGSPMQSPMSDGRRYMSIENSEGHEAVEAQDQNFLLECDSNTSIGNEKDRLKVNPSQSREVSMEVDYKEQQKTPGPSFQAQGFYIKSAESSGHEGSAFPNHSDDTPTASIFYTRGLPPWMLPLQLPDSTEDLENFLYMHRNLQNDNYRNAVKYLRVALYSQPPMVEAFHPLIQLLLLGDQVKEALNEIENFAQNPDTALHSRLKTSLLEYFDHDNYDKLSTYFENILKKDPTCNHSLAKLLSMHQRGDYSTERLVEMIALHLDATFADCNTWKELASCLFKLSQCEEDAMSTCVDRDEQQHLVRINRIPAMFANPESLHAWRLRCRWWLSRHFSQKNLESEMASGEMQLVTYKAAAATHLYGREVKYVAKATQYLEKENNSEMSFILRTHIQNSVGFYFSLKKKNS